MSMFPLLHFYGARQNSCAFNISAALYSDLTFGMNCLNAGEGSGRPILVLSFQIIF